MAFNNSFTAVTGATYTAAQYNTYTRDNLTAVWVYTTAGDFAYATSATTLNRLGLTAAYDILQINAGVTAPAWVSGTPKATLVYNSTDLARTAQAMTWNSEVYDDGGWHSTVSNTSRITVDATAHYRIMSSITLWMPSGGSTNNNHQLQIRQYNSIGTLLGTFVDRQSFYEDGQTVQLHPADGLRLSFSANDYIELYVPGTETINGVNSFLGLERVRPG